MAQTPTSGVWQRYGVLAVRYFFGGHALVSGANHFLHVVPEIMPKSPDVAVRFMGVLVETHMFDLVKVIETLCGISLLTGLYMPLALAMEMPVTVIICYLSLFIAPTPRSFYTGPREVLLNAFLLATYWGWFRNVFFVARAPLRPFWRQE